MAAAGFVNTHSRQQVIDVTVPYYEEPTTLLIPPPTEDSKLFACLKPFQFQVLQRRHVSWYLVTWLVFFYCVFDRCGLVCCWLSACFRC